MNPYLLLSSATGALCTCLALAALENELQEARDALSEHT